MSEPIFRSRLQRLALSLALAAPLATIAGPASAIVDEIVVNATKRPVSLQDVPVAVTPISAELARQTSITDLRDAIRVAPSFSFQTGQSTAAGTTAFIRGIGTGGDNPGFESAVGFFIDGVFRNRSNVAISELPELDHIEILRGPQGTLFGRNTSAGAVTVVTRAPQFTFGSFGEASYGNYDAWDVRGGVTGPVAGDTLAMSFEGKVRKADGYIEDVRGDKDLNNKDRFLLRGQALWQPNADVSLRVIADYSETDEFCCSAVVLHEGVTAPAINGVAGIVGAVGLVAPDGDRWRTSVSPERDTLEAIEEIGISGELNWDFGWSKLTSISSYRDWSVKRNMDIDFTDVDRSLRDGYKTGFKTFTEELRLQGKRDWLDWLAGLYFVDERLPHKDTVRFGRDSYLYVDLLAYSLAGGTQLYGSLPAGTFGAPVATLGAAGFLTALPDGYGQNADRYTVDTTSFAAFTHDSISLTDALTLTLGLRFNHERKEIDADLSSTAPACDELAAIEGIAPGTIAALGDLALLACNPTINTEANTVNGRFVSTGAPASGSREENEWTGTASLAYRFTPDVMAYASYARGYKAGGYNLDRASFDGLLFGGNGAQISDLAFEPEFVDAYELGWKTQLFSRDLTFNGAVFYEKFHDYQINYFSGAAFVTRNAKEVVSKGVDFDLIAQPTEGLLLRGGLLYNEASYGDDIGLNIGGNDVDGRQLFNAPRWVVTGAATWRFPVSNTGLTGIVHNDMRWNTRYISYADLDPLKGNDSFLIWNARVGIAGEGEAWGLDFFVKNLTDEFYSVLAFDLPEQPGTVGAYPNEPRMFGVTGRVRF